ncbi:MAG TPA: hypothetical protein VFF79_06030 [Conexibacter sp.]|jgi:hypothetical protein|nr:hypothetical protein [Conexibacter sp.]
MIESRQPPAEPQPELVEPEETVDGVPVLATEVRALAPASPRRQLPAVQAAAVAATGFVAGAATVVAISRHVSRKPTVRRRRKRAAGPETLSVLGTRSFLLDVHVLGRGE